jgi:hypothetical protein
VSAPNEQGTVNALSARSSTNNLRIAKRCGNVDLHAYRRASGVARSFFHFFDRNFQNAEQAASVVPNPDRSQDDSDDSPEYIRDMRNAQCSLQ